MRLDHLLSKEFLEHWECQGRNDVRAAAARRGLGLCLGGAKNTSWAVLALGCLPARVCVGGGMLSGSGAVRPGCGLRGLCLFWSVEGCGLWWVGWL